MAETDGLNGLTYYLIRFGAVGGYSAQGSDGNFVSLVTGRSSRRSIEKALFIADWSY